MKGLKPDGSLEDGLEAQIERAWSNLLDIMQAMEFDKTGLIRAII